MALGLGIASGIVWPALLVQADEPTEKKTSPVSYYRDIRPIFQANCHGCHQPAKAKGRYVMTSFASLLSGSGEHPVIVPHQPDQSELVEMITPIDGESEMPKKGDPLNPAQID
ncbi:MAG: c-type cytochrome domain-containing protein, partial [bacterium]